VDGTRTASENGDIYCLDLRFMRLGERAGFRTFGRDNHGHPTLFPSAESFPGRLSRE
jgi:hypothetical protein